MYAGGPADAHGPVTGDTAIAGAVLIALDLPNPANFGLNEKNVNVCRVSRVSARAQRRERQLVWVADLAVSFAR